MTAGFLYLVAVMDWASRHVLAWRLSNTMDTGFCIEALEAALRTLMSSSARKSTSRRTSPEIVACGSDSRPTGL